MRACFCIDRAGHGVALTAPGLRPRHHVSGHARPVQPGRCPCFPPPAACGVLVLFKSVSVSLLHPIAFPFRVHASHVQIATGGVDKTVKLFDLASGTVRPANTAPWPPPPRVLDHAGSPSYFEQIAHAHFPSSHLHAWCLGIAVFCWARYAFLCPTSWISVFFRADCEHPGRPLQESHFGFASPHHRCGGVGLFGWHSEDLGQHLCVFTQCLLQLWSPLGPWLDVWECAWGCSLHAKL